MLALSRPCREFQDARFSNGYGHIQIDNRSMTAHRVAFIEAVGDPGPGLDIDHMCNNKACVELTHLQALTRSQNTRRAYTMCRKGLHPLTPDNVRMHSGRRRCIVCADALAARRVR